MDVDELVDVVVVGAGASGLAAAAKLAAQPPPTTPRAAYAPSAPPTKIVVLEASHKVGGRVQHDLTLLGKPLELGPEFIHGDQQNALLDLIRAGVKDKPHATVLELEWPNYYYLGKEGAMLSSKEAEALPEVKQMNEAFEKLAGLDAASLPDTSLLNYFASEGVSSRALDLADAVYANDYCAQLSEVGLRETIHEQRAWRHGEKYLVCSGFCLQDAMETLAHGLDVRLRWEATRVVRTADGNVAVEGANGQRIRARRVIVSIPLKALQRAALEFVPPLPAPKEAAIGRVLVGNAVKIFIRFERRFWPPDFFDAVCADCFFPEVWLTPAADAMGVDSRPPYVMVGFVAGERAERVGRLAGDEAARLLLAQLDTMFGSRLEPHPASKAYVAHIIKDWSQDRLARGAYSHPTIGAHGARAVIGSPVDDRLFFCGEACNEAVNPCVNGAMESGRLAAQLVERSLQAGSSALPFLSPPTSKL